MSARRPEAIDPGGRLSLEAGSSLAPNPSGNAAGRLLPLLPGRRASMMQEPVLVLNATYEPINVTAVRRAMVLLLKGVAQAEEVHSAEVHSAAHAHKVPSVIRLLAYRHIPQQSRALSRKNILLRDRNTCQFCGRVFPSSELTLDHVLPRSRGGRSSWENLVACCYRCNNTKGDRTPEPLDSSGPSSPAAPARNGTRKVPAGRSHMRLLDTWDSPWHLGTASSTIVAGHRHADRVVPQCRPLRDDVVHLAVVGHDVQGDLR